MLLDNPMIAPELTFAEPASMDDAVNYDRDADFLEKIIQKNTDFNMVQKGGIIMKCTKCGQECFDEEYPQVVFHDDKYCICEECSIDYEENDITGKVQYRKDLEEEGCIEEFNEVMINKLQIETVEGGE